MAKKIAKATVDERKKSQAKQAVDLHFIGSPSESADSRTPASRERLREQVSDEVAQFLAKGGKINHVDKHVTADPPRKPNYQYGQRPI